MANKYEMFKILRHKGNENQYENQNQFYLTPVRTAIIQNSG